ncbi:MAG: NAD(P)H-hydrate dehydratase [Candidatus Portnoybacteria bacterium]
MIKEITKDILKEVYEKRSLDSRKYDFGLLVVIGGSEFYSGSPALSAMAAFKTGVDMVRIFAPKRAADIAASFSPNLAAYPLAGDWLKKEHLSILVTQTEAAKQVARGKAAVVIGGGAGRSKETQEVILKYLSEISLPAIIDADAINALEGNAGVIAGKSFLVLPHSQEFFVLTGKTIKGLSDEDKIKLVESEAGRLQTTILLKGKIDIISDGKETAVNKTGSPYMTVGGTGDVLAGICGALMAKGIPSNLAAKAGAFINGKAGELASARKKDSFLATDLIEAIPEAIQ